VTGREIPRQKTYAVDFTGLLRLSGNALCKEHRAKGKDRYFLLHVFFFASIHVTLNTRLSPNSLRTSFERYLSRRLRE
jgi:hypothetical protein